MISLRLFRCCFLFFMFVYCFGCLMLHGVTRGLINQGNSCYMNAAVQCLIHVKPFVEYILRNQEKFRTNPETSHLVDFFLAMRSQDQTPFSPNSFYQQNFIGTMYAQEDSAEFLTTFLDKVVMADGEHVSKIKTIFNLKQLSTTTCDVCHRENKKEEDMRTIKLGVLPDEKTPNLMALLDRHFAEELLDGDNQYECEDCRKLVPGKKKLTLSAASENDLPPFVIIELKRFTYACDWVWDAPLRKNVAINFRSFKIMTPITFPVEGLTFRADFMSTPFVPQPVYDLCGIVRHGGSVTGGHYYAYCKDYDSGMWFCCDDSNAYQVPLSKINDIASQKQEPGGPYILFYQKRGVAGVGGISGAALSGGSSAGGLSGLPSTGVVAPSTTNTQAPVITEELAQDLVGLQLSFDDRKIRLLTLGKIFHAKTAAGKTPLHLFVDFLSGLNNYYYDGAENDFCGDEGFSVELFCENLDRNKQLEYLAWLLDTIDTTAFFIDGDTEKTALHYFIDLRESIVFNEDDGIFFLDVLRTFAEKKPECFNLSNNLGWTPFYYLVSKLVTWKNKIDPLFPYFTIMQEIFNKGVPFQLDRRTYDNRNILHALLQASLPESDDDERSKRIEVISKALTLFFTKTVSSNFSSNEANPKQGVCDLLWERDDFGKMPLHYAFEKKNIEAAKKVLDFLFSNGRASLSFFNQQFKVIEKDGSEKIVKQIQELISQNGLDDYVERLRSGNKNLKQEEWSDSSVGRLVKYFEKHAEHGSKSKPKDKPMSPLQQKLFDLSESLKRLKFGLGRLQSGLKSLASKLGL